MAHMTRIDFIHVFTPILLLLFLGGCPSSETSKTPFEGERAYKDLEQIVAIGPRVSGTPASERARAYIREQVQQAGVTVTEHPFTARTPYGKKPMVNLVAEVHGTKPGVIVLGNHYDTKYFPDFEFVGANDGGSTTAWMIEMARALGPERDGYTVWLCWFDGEEAFKEWTDQDSLYGSRHFVQRLREEGRLDDVRAMLNVDMIGDCDLGVIRDPGAPAWLANLVWSTANELGYGRYFTPMAEAITDDQEPFRQAGILAINLIDFRYGGGRVEHQMNWHTARDRLDLVCPESLQVVGDVVYRLLPRLDASARGSEG